MSEVVINPFVTSLGDLRDLGKPFRCEPQRSAGLIEWDNYAVIKYLFQKP